MSPKGTYSFHKNERLCNKRQIEKLYASKCRMMVYPLSIHWIVVDGSSQSSRLQVLIVAPKKKLHHAVDRNRMKRLMRECYRIRKHTLLQILQKTNRDMLLAINYMHSELTDSEYLGKRFDKLFDALCTQIQQQQTTIN